MQKKCISCVIKLNNFSFSFHRLSAVCKSCIVKYLQTSKYCPMCNIKIHETQPLLNLKLDRVMQDIVYKLVPGLQESKYKERDHLNLSVCLSPGQSWLNIHLVFSGEDKRIKEFYQSRGLERIIQPSGEGKWHHVDRCCCRFDFIKIVIKYVCVFL